MRDIVGLYLDPPDKALVLCVDEKTQIQALERQQRSRINEFVAAYNNGCRPFAWTATAESILAKVERIGLICFRDGTR